MKQTSYKSEGGSLRRRAIWVVVAVGIASLYPSVGLPELRPLVRQMLENLGAVNQIGEGIALEDYDQVARAALDLKERADAMKRVDLTVLGLDPDRDSQFDAYLTAQGRAADAILQAAKAEDSQSTLLGLQKLLEGACLACHADFREGNRLLSPSVLFMTTFTSAWKEINRGLLIDDLVLVGKSARELQSMARVLSWDQVIESAFDLTDAAERQEFQKLLARVAAQAARMEQASIEGDVDKVLLADRLMWNEGCVACHDRFR
jgi:cytochrome c556